MKKSLLAIAWLAIAAFCVPAAAQTMPVNLNWTNPTAASDGSPLTGANAQTGVEVHWATASIPDAPACTLPCTGARVAQVVLTTAASSSTHQISSTNGQTWYFRVKATNATGRSAFSNEATKVASFPVPPGPPTQLRVDLVLSRDENGVWSMAMVAWDDSHYNGG